MSEAVFIGIDVSRDTLEVGSSAKARLGGTATTAPASRR